MLALLCFLLAQTDAPVSRAEILDRVERLARFMVQHQSDSGAIIDPLLDREFQYATPYFAFGVGALIEGDRAEDLWPAGIAAMEHATRCIGEGRASIPDDHGEFFLAPLADALELYAEAVDADTMARWRERMSIPIDQVIEGRGEKINNWRTYAMKGEWARYRAGLVEREDAVAFIEDAWLNRTQRERIANSTNLYEDWNGHPQSHAVEAVGRGNLLALIASGYDGPSAGEIRSRVLSGTEVSLRLQDPTGQCPPNGRTDNHVFNDVLYALIFETAAQLSVDANENAAAGPYRRASDLSVRSIERWARDDPPWTGAYSITKNHFDPAQRVGYQPASQVSNYTGATIYHLAELYLARQLGIAPTPAPCETGGYVQTVGPRFGSVFANAGGMQVVANLLGDSVPKYGDYWTPLGIVRFARAGWDSRLGPSDGARTVAGSATFAPTWIERGEWVRLADKAEHYQGTFTQHAAQETRVECTILYAPITGVGGPIFRMHLVITPTGVTCTLTSPNDVEFGLTIPLLVDDGRPLEILREPWGAGTRYAAGQDEQWFIGLDDDQTWTDDGENILSTYGRLKPLRVTSETDAVRVFVYPRRPGEPDAQTRRESIGEFVEQ